MSCGRSVCKRSSRFWYEEESESVIRAKLAELEDKLLDWECEEPDDVLGSAYDAWEEGREQLEDAISDLEDLLDE